MHVTLYRKYRPKTFDEIVGEGEIVKTLKNSLRNNKLAHAYLFTGPRGVGKTTIARLIAKGINCVSGITDTPCGECENCKEIVNNSFLDMIEIDAASNRGIDEIRELKEKINYAPTKGRKKVYIIDEVHMLTKEAFNALLKTLEEPPEHVIFILATTEPDKILSTIISRCQRYDFKSVSYKELSYRLKDISYKEGYEIDENSLQDIYELSDGSVRDAISILERVMMNVEDNNITYERTEKLLGITSRKSIEEFLEILMDKRYEEAINFLEEIWKNTLDIEIFFKDVAKIVKDKIVSKDIELEFGLKIIENIYDILAKFQYEENKRLIAFVIMSRLIEVKDKQEDIRILEKEIRDVKELETKLEKEREREHIDIIENKKSISIQEFKERWEEIVEEAKRRRVTFGAFLVEAYPKDVVGNNLIIGFRTKQTFSKSMLEMEPYKSIFREIINDKLGGNLTISYDNIVKEEDGLKDQRNELADKIIDFFGGELL